MRFEPILSYQTWKFHVLASIFRLSDIVSGAGMAQKLRTKLNWRSSKNGFFLGYLFLNKWFLKNILFAV